MERMECTYGCTHHIYIHVSGAARRGARIRSVLHERKEAVLRDDNDNPYNNWLSAITTIVAAFLLVTIGECQFETSTLYCLVTLLVCLLLVSFCGQRNPSEQKLTLKVLYPFSSPIPCRRDQRDRPFVRLTVAQYSSHSNLFEFDWSTVHWKRAVQSLFLKQPHCHSLVGCWVESLCTTIRLASLSLYLVCCSVDY